MRLIYPSTLSCIITALFILQHHISALKHHLVLTNDHRVYFSVSSFGYYVGGRLEVIVQNLTLSPEPSEEAGPQFGFILIKSDQARSPFLMDPATDHRDTSCMLVNPRNYYSQELITFGISPTDKKVVVRCTGDNDPLPSIEYMSYSPRHVGSHSSYKHTFNKRASWVPKASRRSELDFRLHQCHDSPDLPLIVQRNAQDINTYSFNFTMLIKRTQEEGFYYLTFHNCHGRHHGQIALDDSRRFRTPTNFNLSLLIDEFNYPENYLSAGKMPLPQTYFILSVMYFLIGTVWINFIARQRESALKIHYLMTVLVFAKACSLLFHGINYHYIALDGQPVVTWAYLDYATRSIKGGLFFITLALIGSGWSFIKHILSDKDKKIIMFIIALQVIAHVAEIVSEESTEGEASNEFWHELCGLVDLFSCVAILYPISWSVRHLEEASRTDGKAAINLRKLELFKRFYIISTIYIYVTRIVTFVFLSMLSYKYSWLADLQFELVTLIYFIVTGYYFQPMPTNPYLLLSTDNEGDEDILFSRDQNDVQMDDIETSNPNDVLISDGRQKVTRRIVEDIV